VKQATLSIVSGTATYTLATDCLKLIALDALANAEGLIISSAGLIPVSPDFEETWLVSNGQITFYPTPTYTLDRDYQYQAGWALDGTSQAYTDMGDEEAGIVLLLATGKALTMQANKAAQEAWQYQLGDERVNKEALAAALREQAKQAVSEYEAAVRNYGAGPFGCVATYPDGSYA
jgi:hypothetical protein